MAFLLPGFWLLSAPAVAQDFLQCVPYARQVSGIEIYGDAVTWWDQAQDRYKRGNKPKKGAVLAFRANGPMTLGHVAVVSKILDDREILVRHANWSSPGAIEEDVRVVDVSEEGDWSQVRVWFSPNGQMGARTNPTFGFIYGRKAKLHPFTPDDSLGLSTRLASSPVSPSAMVAAPAPRAPMFARSVSPRSAPQPARRIQPATEAIARDDPFIVEYADASGAARRLGEIIADVKREARLN
ncbi:hypothetical protein GGR44_001452 [Sphingobium fontiphilum]|uniref:Peptidase C51 domain-containing protein n=1 Tax=Sphingobium fontiphilum TaxID=944425 RepID=A0A7W6DL03_9SPHN|nr:CHAP domain-containing protein [Sphingobium fontiphilum]MBB3981793.1 hypothetical protein [Sphingobium fontiphilum]